MNTVEELQQEIQSLRDKLDLKDKEIDLLKKELNIQLNYREKELVEQAKIVNKQNQLEKRYAALRNSFLGKLTIKYWNLRKKVGKGGAL